MFVAPAIAVAEYKHYRDEVALENSGLELCGRYCASLTAIAATIADDDDEN